MDEQYLTEEHYLVCDKGAYPLRMTVSSQNIAHIRGHLAATTADTMKKKVFTCLGKVAFVAGVVAGLCCCIPGPGWVVAAAIALVVLAAIGIAIAKCMSASTSREWQNHAGCFTIQGNNGLLLSSTLYCKAQGGYITPKETLWAAWGSAALTNLGHLANFAFGFLAGRGMGSMVAGAGGAAGGSIKITSDVAKTLVQQGFKESSKKFGLQFLNTAKTELLEQFTFKGMPNLIRQKQWFCVAMRGFGIGGAYYDQYQIWSSDEDFLTKLRQSGIGLIMSVFAAKGATTTCFPAGTKVHAENGLRNIEDLREGDFVLTFNFEKNEKEYKPIVKKYERYALQMRTLELASGEFLEVTPEHKFFTNDEWIEAGALKAGDILRTKSGDYTTILGIDTLFKYEKVYNFDVEDNENYYVTAEGLLVHNGRYRAIDKGADYEKQIQDIYGGSGSQADRTYQGFVDGKPVKGIADNITGTTAIEAKYVDDWEKSLRNPANTEHWALAEQQKMLDQARKYSDAFDEVIYHTNSQELADYYSQVFKENGLNNVEFKIAPPDF